MIQELSLNLWTEIILDINANPKTNITETYKRVGCTYAHVLNILKLLEHHQYIIMNRDGPAIYLSLTKKGIDVANHIQYIKQNIGGNKNG